MSPNSSLFAKIDKKILWALDPFLEDPELSQRMADLLAVLKKQVFTSAKVQPTTVISPDQIGWPAPLQPKWEKHFRNAAHQRLSKFLSGTPPTEDILFITQASSSRRRSVAELLRTAAHEDALFIAVSTSARKGLERLALGSFCETLISSAKIPCLTVNPDTRIPEKIDSIYFPTDFSDVSKAQLMEAAKIASTANAKLVLVHKLLAPVPWVTESGFMAAGTDLTTMEMLFQSNREAQEKRAASWKAEVEAMNVSCEYRALSSAMSLADSLLETFAVEQNALLVMALEKEVSLSAILGHIIRLMVRSCSLPVLTLPPKDE